MCDDGSFDNSLYTVTFHPNLRTAVSNKKSDSAVLVPDSIGIDENPKTQVSSPQNTFNELKKDDKKSPKINEYGNLESVKINQNNITSCKRLSSETLNEDRVKRYNKGDQTENNSGSVQIKKDKLSNMKVHKDVTSSSVSQTSKIFVESKNTATAIKNEEKDSLKSNEISSNENLTGRISPDKFIGTPKNNTSLENNLIKEVKHRGTAYETSPSLIPENAKAQIKFIDLEATSNDNDDFQEKVSSSKAAQSEDSWETCDKRKSQKNRVMKAIKCTSKFKMSLDAPPLNYKKPNYKQAKLSKTFFQPKNSKANSNKKSPQKSSVIKTNDEPQEEENDSLIILDKFQTSTPCDILTSVSAFDIDATFIPENYKAEITECATTNVKKSAVEKLHLRNSNLFSNISFPVDSKSTEKIYSSKKEGK